MTLAFEARHRLGEFRLDVSFASKGRLTALFGASGSGKSTVVNLIAGLVRPTDARIEVDGEVLVDTSRRVFVPMHRRRIGYVFQDARLFPHLTVDQNLGYGRFFAPAAERYADPGAVIAMLGLGHLLARRPGTLSGGERQRVAIGRALLSSPRLMLMDEPLASLDEARKAEILPYIERLRDDSGVPIVYVSHAIAEVARLASDVVVLQDGKAVASGPAGDVLASLDLVADDGFDEASVLIELRVAEHGPSGLTVLEGSSGQWRVPRLDLPVGAMLRARVRARDVMLATERPAGISALNILPGVIEQIAPGARQSRLVRIACGEDRILARITAHSVTALDLAVGSKVYAIVKAINFADHNQPSIRPKGS